MLKEVAEILGISAYQTIYIVPLRDIIKTMVGSYSLQSTSDTGGILSKERVGLMAFGGPVNSFV